MKDIIKDIKEPSHSKGLYVITYVDNNCNEYTSYTTKNGYKKALMYDKFRQLGYDISLLESFEDIIIENWKDNNEY